MDTKYDFLPKDANNIVYVRPVAVADLPEEVRDQMVGVERLYAVHDTKGERLALVKDRKLAFALARQHDLAPVNAH
ncbi:MAG: DUF1150 domain-containing protein [Confluentimicrobium sp.]|jgi:hypothetical protein|uniref:DUF1150 family protein n=1 Tax=Actibacterium naphthalenivorans TaxID=1614693 RepID=A0A840CAD9_9RHOB|nr:MULTISPECIES: DUF1150 family protein [Actibacterium]KGB83164.1 hypothetical protein JT55_03535 [Rhodovulum sp. NI22]MDY6859992.1 DUF1150 family protein [Pseudomonadota bacterium]ALG89356.1 hypothetical protein TQ29_03140 [Actibacterium sp. EMB200-NS6]MBB4021032.1 hypothetical protein [Actibacterium naphthalenivorans]MBC56386.1 DUF1150 domain-containing protein [Actibacterium sp.]|tara:strand:- start:1316 stop:1543 length:228 start_codon:yes stop_codon:yes gene_type:complete